MESVHVSIRTRKLTNRGFLRGPFLPLYGSGAIMMLLVSMPFQENGVMVYVAGCIGATILEYVTGILMETLFKVRYWDYSKYPLNFQGRVCIGTTLAWGLLTILMTRVIHVPVERFVLAIPDKVLLIVTLILSIIIIADFALSFKAAIDLKNVLQKMEGVKREMLRIQRRLDAITAAAGQGLHNAGQSLHSAGRSLQNAGRSLRNVGRGLRGGREMPEEGMDAARDELPEGMSVRLEDVKANIEGRLESIRNLAQTKPSEYWESMKEELIELKTRYAVNLEIRRYLGGLKDFFQRDMIRSNPGMTSEEFGEELEELKDRIDEKEEPEEFQGAKSGAGSERRS